MKRNNNIIRFILSLFLVLNFIMIESAKAFFRQIDASPKIICNELGLIKKVFYSNKNMTFITNIICNDLDLEKGPDIGIFDQFNLFVTDLGGKLKSTTTFEWEIGVLDSDVFMESTGGYKIVIKDQNPVGVLNRDGKPVWKYDDPAAFHMTFGDTDNDGLPEYYIASTSLVKLDEEGKIVWTTKPAIYTAVSVCDGTKGGDDIITLNHARKIQFWNNHGYLNSEWEPKNILGFDICKWLNKNLIIGFYFNLIEVFDYDGNNVFCYRLPFGPSEIYSIRVESVVFNKKEYLAVLVKFSSAKGLSMLCLFSLDKKLVYQELLKVTTGILAVTQNDQESQLLLVGDGPGRVNSYSISKRW